MADAVAAGQGWCLVLAGVRGSLIVLAPGILAAPNLNRGLALGIAAVVASIAAGLKTIQMYVNQVSVAHFVPGPLGALIDLFLRAFVAAFLTSIVGILNMPTLSFSKSLVVAVLIGAFTAGMRAVEGTLTKGEWPLRNQGIGAQAQTGGVATA